MPNRKSTNRARRTRRRRSSVHKKSVGGAARRFEFTEDFTTVNELRDKLDILIRAGKGDKEVFATDMHPSVGYSESDKVGHITLYYNRDDGPVDVVIY